MKKAEGQKFVCSMLGKYGKGILFQLYIFLILTGIGIGSVEYIRWCRRSLPASADIPPKIALTFDDGPHSVYTPKLLEGLREQDVRATFFLIGENIVGKEEIVKQMAADGHLIGNHTWSHVDITKIDAEEACKELTKTSSLIKSLVGYDTEYVRPPFGAWRKELECGFEMFPVLWTIDPLDWKTENADEIVRKVKREVKENAIILLHDCYASSVEAALKIVEALKAEGYEFVTVEELVLE